MHIIEFMDMYNSASWLLKIASHLDNFSKSIFLVNIINGYEHIHNLYIPSIFHHYSIFR